MLIKTEGIVIRTTDYGEGNKIVTLFTNTHGKIAVMAKGAKKSRSRLHAVTQLFSYGEYIFYKGNQMGTLNQGDFLEHFIDIYYDIDKTAYASYLVEMVDKLTEQNIPNINLFNQLHFALLAINQGKDLEIIARIFEMKMFYHAGYRPHLHSCSICGKEDSLTAFSIMHGGLICNNHSNEKAILIQSGTIKLLRLFEYMDLSRLGNIEVKSSTKSQLEMVMRSFFDEYIGTPLKSRNFLDQLTAFKE